MAVRDSWDAKAGQESQAAMAVRESHPHVPSPTGIVDGRQTRSRPDTETLTGDEENAGDRFASPALVTLVMAEKPKHSSCETTCKRNSSYDLLHGKPCPFHTIGMEDYLPGLW
ncbi:hypothetical protein DPX16_8664 [Anabarilius grahami]|uniref:Uncharacterized protein n=1 Tax=Anabarilius grahami TaxID=495550 RepID=A0A3N0Y996_ANAGA|nr:hypothetical protein DPX16_8664 [Anabarilius grahami]